MMSETRRQTKPDRGIGNAAGQGDTNMDPFITHSVVGRRSDDEQSVFERDFANGSALKILRGNGTARLPFDRDGFPFHDLVCDMLVDKGVLNRTQAAEMGNLGQLHRFLPQSAMDFDADELNEISRQFYDQSAGFIAAYHRFLTEVIMPTVVGGDFVFQRTPTIRFNFPNAGGFNWKPRYHTDIMLGHPPQEVNCWLPVTNAFASNSMRLAPLTDSLAMLRSIDLDFPRFTAEVQQNHALVSRCEAISEPVTIDYGNVLLFDSRCLHCTQQNVSDATRISFDFRIMAAPSYAAMGIDYRGSGRRKMLFRKGEYFDQRTAAELTAAP